MPNQHHVTIEDVRRIVLLLRALEAAALDPDSATATAALERAHLDDGRLLSNVGDTLLALELAHAACILDALVGHALDGRPVEVPALRRAPLRICAEPGCPEYVELWRCHAHDLSHAERRNAP